MSNPKKVVTWKGRRLEDLTIEELREAVSLMAYLLDKQRVTHAHERKVLLGLK